jgi:uncharacterized protein (TIGR02996 family)
VTDGDALLAAIRAHPDEDTPRLVYADWLDENGSPARARFIRDMIDPEKKRRSHITMEHIAVRMGLPSLTVADARSWGFWPWADSRFTVRYRVGDRSFVLTDRNGNDFSGASFLRPIGAVVRRGFVESVRLRADEWFALADSLRGDYPLRSVDLTTVPTHHELRDEFLKMDDHQGARRVGYEPIQESLRSIPRFHGLAFHVPPF